jgi:hypothetical protein
LELEIERVKRDLINAEDQLEGARRDLTKRDLEVAQMVSPLHFGSFCPDLPPRPFLLLVNAPIFDQISFFPGLRGDCKIMLTPQMDKQRDLENRLSSERQGRLNLSDKLDEVSKVSYSPWIGLS